MKCSEKDYEFVEIDNEAFGGYIKMPGFVTKFFLKANVKKLRKMMGGESKDISQRTINSEDKNIKGYKSDIRIRIYTPEGNEKRPLMVFFHGGGWIGGSIDAVHHYCMAVADRANAIVISVDYHLAPEAPFPEGLEDCYAAVKWAVNNSEELNIDKDNVSISGDSAGGNYSAVISIMARERKDITIHRQILLYPATDLSDMISDKVGKQERAFGEAMIEMYLKNKVKANDPYVSPMKCADLSNLPDALLVVGDLDFLKESTLAYAKKLDEAGNSVSISIYKNTRHAFIDNTGNCNQAEDFINEVVEFIRG
ncbi:MAG: alpha/beta hydrolase [Clostridium sp.]|uniref:alpha/beta hydrolase n=1 Tax=Clostridium sp. TaxID=1506 RepID=UPI00302D93CF